MLRQGPMTPTVYVETSESRLNPQAIPNRLGNAGRHPRGSPRRAHRLEPAQSHGVRSCNGHGAMVRHREQVRSHPDAGGRAGSRLRILGPRGPNDRHPSWRAWRCHRQSRRLAELEGRTVRAVRHHRRRAALHDQRHAGRRHQLRGHDRQGSIPRTSREGSEGRLFGVTRHRGRKSVLHQRRRRDVRPENGTRVRATARESTGRANPRLTRARGWSLVLPNAKRADLYRKLTRAYIWIVLANKDVLAHDTKKSTRPSRRTKNRHPLT